VAEGLDVVIDHMVGDWRETLEAIETVTDVDTASGLCGHVDGSPLRPAAGRGAR
jgi:hypothetical protein